MTSYAKSYKDLIVWQKSIELVTEVYKLTAKFPRHEVYGLASQIQRAATFIASNIAEGSSRGTTKDFVHFLRMALGSATELETQFVIATNLGYRAASKDTRSVNLLSEVCRMLHGMIKKLNSSDN
ncbi:MAG: hypothetical protein UY39_C0015G0003 [Candidatus Kaiserbacteria bacterium GW2011_GWC2_49_12]|uniref:Four helix bundle protein n=3 Tax=Candidatus Kaiseribacteriota TaxID=1752734 RepID=A0A0G1ZDD8_9BACT|nr:MAG: hypothetical protein UY39_C0015G0003 [Candidatus Kaiserbacteria bacterium GW2011_GWC2_49_12]KKW17189.1 MAG: hypothetical protein UY57_C0023G0003 [Candidatus Kaiserbacteria bacterium GW2011_GWB1_50_17]OGG88257.1 MAG: hypothetical protein A3H15_00845 [Candidatus Kaiserbacteria bacterium RIFCSPLOWO2_12_FULL_50_28]HCM43982.1 four helix bundle protein [Candidatus Kaiserbacteria bacterium]